MQEATGCVIAIDSIKPVDRGQGIFSLPLIGREQGAKQLLVGITVIPPGQEVPLHTHDNEESIVVLEGTGTCELDGTQRSVAKYDATWVPPGTTHRFINSGDVPLRILWTYGSVNTTRTIVQSGATTAHLDQYGDPADA